MMIPNSILAQLRLAGLSVTLTLSDGRFEPYVDDRELYDRILATTPLGALIAANPDVVGARLVADLLEEASERSYFSCPRCGLAGNNIASVRDSALRVCTTCLLAFHPPAVPEYREPSALDGRGVAFDPTRRMPNQRYRPTPRSRQSSDQGPPRVRRD
jgi:hypothetical protein